MDDPLRVTGGFADLLGYRLGEWREDYAEVLLEVEAKHMNRSGVLHGGVVTTMLDAALGYAGTHCAVPENIRRAFTLSLTCNFIGTAEVGQTLTAVARRTGGGQRVYFCSGEVRDKTGRLVAQADGVFRYRGRSGDPRGVPRAELGV